MNTPTANLTLRKEPAMPAVRPLALVIDHDFGFLGRAAASVYRAGYQVSARLSPRGLGEFTRILRPDLILLGLPFWEQGWAPVLRSFSPDTLLYPIAAESDVPGVADLATLQALLAVSREEKVHAA